MEKTPLISGEHNQTVPGSWLGRISTHIAGEGTFTDNNSIYASIRGAVSVTPHSSLPMISVTVSIHSAMHNTQIYLPKIGDLVYGRVLYIYIYI